MTVVVHSAVDILAMLNRGLTPITDNRDALIGLGFEPAYPQIRSGYDSKIWERSVAVGAALPGGMRRVARERAFLERKR
jgi:hypothetical protein